MLKWQGHQFIAASCSTTWILALWLYVHTCEVKNGMGLSPNIWRAFWQNNKYNVTITIQTAVRKYHPKLAFRSKDWWSGPFFANFVSFVILNIHFIDCVNGFVILLLKSVKTTRILFALSPLLNGNIQTVFKCIHFTLATLKDFFRELPEPLFTNALYPMVYEATQVASPGDSHMGTKLILNILDCLPTSNQVGSTYDFYTRWLPRENKLSLVP